MRLLACESIYRIGIIADIEITYTKLFNKSQILENAAKGETDTPRSSRNTVKVVGADLFSLYHRTCLCIVDYHSMFPLMKKKDSLSAHSLILACKVILSECGLPRKIMSNVGGEFVSENSRNSVKN